MMARATYVPITGLVLDWAMREAGVDDEELAERCSTEASVVAQWREGETKPTKTQFRALVSRLRRPSAIYFLAEPPREDPTLRAFRYPPATLGERDLSDPEVRAIRTAERIQRIARWVREQRGDSLVELPPGPSTGAEITQAVRAARQFLRWSVRDQTDAASSSEVARALRGRLEDVGILVLQLPMKQEGCRGFSLHDDLAPVIAVNSAYNTEARIFSFLHEFAHLASGADSICARVPDSSVERRCERFAARFLMPKPAFTEWVVNRFGESVSSIDDVGRIARHFKVSLRATALRLEAVELAAAGLYERVDADADFKGEGGFSRDNSAPAIRLREWGTGFASLLMAAEDAGVLTRPDVLEYFNLSNGQLRELHDRVEFASED